MVYIFVFVIEEETELLSSTCAVRRYVWISVRCVVSSEQSRHRVQSKMFRMHRFWKSSRNISSSVFLPRIELRERNCRIPFNELVQSQVATASMHLLERSRTTRSLSKLYKIFLCNFLFFTIANVYGSRWTILDEKRQKTDANDNGANTYGRLKTSNRGARRVREGLASVNLTRLWNRNTRFSVGGWTPCRDGRYRGK